MTLDWRVPKQSAHQCTKSVPASGPCPPAARHLLVQSGAPRSNARTFSLKFSPLPRSCGLAALWLLAITCPPAIAVELTDCRLEDTGGLRTVAAECGTLSVPLDPQVPDGEHIELFIARIRALTASAPADAFTVIAGGPGAASTEFYVSQEGAFSRVRRDRDIVLVDQRGTGRSNPLDCPEPPEDTDMAEYSAELVKEASRDCLSSLDADPRFFTTSVAVRDLDELRKALGYAQLNVYGVSYGTRVAQHYLRRYPDQTRSVILDGVVPADLPLGPAISLDAQAAVEQMFNRCAQDAACAEAFPDLRDGFDELAAQLADEPASVMLQDPLVGGSTTEQLSAPAFQAAVRLLSYSTETVSILPLVLHSAYADGDFAPLAAQAAMVTRRTNELLSYGMHNAVVCTEDVPFYEPAAVERTALEQTYLGTAMFDGLSDICSVWPAGVIDEDFKAPVVSDRPVLVLSGSADPVTPAAYGERILGDRDEPWLTAARHLVVEGQGHGQAAVGCMPKLLGEFVATPDAAAVDASCLDTGGPAPFFTSFAGPEP